MTGIGATVWMFFILFDRINDNNIDLIERINKNNTEVIKLINENNSEVIYRINTLEVDLAKTMANLSAIEKSVNLLQARTINIEERVIKQSEGLIALERKTIGR